MSGQRTDPYRVLAALVALVPVVLCSCAHPGALDDAGSGLTREALDRSLSAGRQYLLNSQTPDGRFVYQYDFVQRRRTPGDNEVRQAGALWGLTLIHQDRPEEQTALAVRRGLAFFKMNSRLTQDGKRYIAYPGSDNGSTGTVALVGLALVDFMRSGPPDTERARCEADLSEYVQFLLSLRTADGRFHGHYDLGEGRGVGAPSPYSDGETLLMMVEAAKYAGRDDLKDLAVNTAEAMYRIYVKRALARDPDSKATKGFYQWGSMAFHELYTSGWQGVEAYAERTIELAYWMIDVHRTLERGRNTAYAHEGMAVAWELARLTGRRDAVRKIGDVIDQGLGKLISWQVGGPTPNAYLRTHPTDDKLAVGGVMNSASDPVLRIDVAQHQTHAVMLVRRFMYREEPPIGPDGR